MKTVQSVIFLPCLIIILLVTTSFGSDWVGYGRSNDGSLFFYNNVNINHKTKNIIQVWEKIVFSDKLREEVILDRINMGLYKKGYDKLSQSIGLTEIDCKKGISQTISITEYDEDGYVLYSGSSRKSNCNHIVPGSITDLLREKVCKLGSSDWVKCMKNNDGVFFYNQKRIKRRTKDIVQIWEKLDFSDEGREKWIEGKRNMELSIKGYDKLSHSIGMIEIDCKKGMSRGLSMTDYDTDGVVLYSYDNKQDWSHITPDTLIDTFRKKFCK